MILQDLLESHMSNLDIEYQDYKKLEPVAFYSRYKMTPDEWAGKHWSLIKSGETVHEGVTEGIMDVVKQTFNDNVVGWPMGTSNEQFIQGWARDIKAQTGKTIPTAKLVQLYNHYTKRSPELMQTHGTTESQVKEFAPGGNMEPPVPPVTKKRDPWEDDDRSIYPRKIQQLLAAGNKVDSRVPGAMGHIYRANDLSIHMKRLNKPYSQKRYAWYIPQDRDDKLLLKQEKPGYYVLYDRDWLPQGPVVEDVSGLTDAEYNKVARYAKSKYPAMVIAALGRNPDGSINVRMHDTKGLGITKEFKVRFAEPEETDIDEEGVAEGYKDYKAPHNRGRENIDNLDWADKDYPNSTWDDGYDRGNAYGTNNKPRPKHPEGSKEYQQYMDGYEKGVIAHAKRAKACLPDDEQLDETSDETSWTANSAQFRKEEDMSWTFKITIAPNADVNKGRGRREVTKIVSGQSMDAAKKKIREYFLRNGWEVVGIEQVMPEMDTYPHPKSKEGKKLTKAIRDPNAPEVKPQPVKKTVKDATKILNKEFQKSVKEGSQTFGKHDPYWVCVNGKKWKRFDTYEHARAVHDRLEKKLRDEGSDKKISLLADNDVAEGLRNPKDNPCWKGYKPVGTKQKGGRTVPNCVPKE